MTSDKTPAPQSVLADLSKFSLPAYAYYDPEILALERDRIFRKSWQLICHESDIPHEADFCRLDLLGDRAIAIRWPDGTLRCLNGDDVEAEESAGNLQNTNNDKHDWTSLVSGGTGLDCEIFLGFIFVRVDGNGPGLQKLFEPVSDELTPYRFRELKPLGRVKLRPRNANWKNIADNYVDALHIPVAHPGLSDLFGGSYTMDILGDIHRLSGRISGDAKGWSGQAYRDHLPRITQLPETSQDLWLYYRLWPNLAFDIYPDQVDFMQFIPLGPEKTLIREITYGLPDQRRDLRAARYLNWRINRQVNSEDTDLIQRVQEGMKSSAFSIGPFGASEICLRDNAQRIRNLIPELQG